MPKESVTSLKQQNQELKNKVDALLKEITQLKEKVGVDSAITFGAEAAATSGNSNNNASNDKTVSRSLQYLSDEYDDLSASNFDETAAETSALCVKLFQEMEAEVFLSDIDIAHRVPSRQQNGAPKPIICKFVRRLAKASVMETRQSASQVNPSNIGLSADSVLDKPESSITSPPKNNTCCLKRRDLKNRTNTASAGPRIPRFIYARVRVPD